MRNEEWRGSEGKKKKIKATPPPLGLTGACKRFRRHRQGMWFFQHSLTQRIDACELIQLMGAQTPKEVCGFVYFTFSLCTRSSKLQIGLFSLSWRHTTASRLEGCTRCLWTSREWCECRCCMSTTCGREKISLGSLNKVKLCWLLVCENQQGCLLGVVRGDTLPSNGKHKHVHACMSLTTQVPCGRTKMRFHNSHALLPAVVLHQSLSSPILMAVRHLKSTPTES